MEHTLDYAGDPGLFGPDSITWEVMGDVSGFIGGIRALLIQAAHPEVVAGVADHSRYREDPAGPAVAHLGLRHRYLLWRHAGGGAGRAHRAGARTVASWASPIAASRTRPTNRRWRHGSTTR